MGAGLGGNAEGGEGAYWARPTRKVSVTGCCVACRVGRALEYYLFVYLGLDLVRLVSAIPRYAVIEGLFTASTLVYSLLVIRSELIRRRGSV